MTIWAVGFPLLVLGFCVSLYLAIPYRVEF